METYLKYETADDGLPTLTTGEQLNAEDACKDAIFELTDSQGSIDRESYVCLPANSVLFCQACVCDELRVR